MSTIPSFESDQTAQTLARLLGYAGLLPFAMLPIANFYGFGIFSLTAAQAFVAYSAVILSFLAGSLWSSGILAKDSPSRLVLMLVSNSLAISAWFSILMSSQTVAVVALLVAYLILLWAERRLCSDQARPYRLMRVRLTALVALFHLLFLLSG